MTRKLTLLTMLAVFAIGSFSIATADLRLDYRDYNFRPNDQGDFTNSEAWSGKIVAIRGEWIEVVRYGYQVSLKVTQGHPRLYVGERVRVVPFRRDGRDEVAELRLPALNYMPVGVVRYVERTVAKERPPTLYGPQYQDGRWIDVQIGKRGQKTGLRIDARWQKVK
jgi:hypothetical protein